MAEDHGAARKIKRDYVINAAVSRPIRYAEDFQEQKIIEDGGRGRRRRRRRKIRPSNSAGPGPCWDRPISVAA
jgi:hypothetical protein